MSITVGLMSGTSQDGLDAVALAVNDPAVRVLAHRHRPFDDAFRARLAALNGIGTDELRRAADVADELAETAARLVADLLADAGLSRADVRAIGSHGLTLRHRPPGVGGVARGSTWQIDNPALLAELTRIDVVADFRRADVAAGGQGAPLVPAFHAAVFGRPGRARAVLNLGGFANLTLIGTDGRVRGFDTGPANVLLDGWVLRHLGLAFDDDGEWAAGGAVDAVLLTRLLADTFFAAPPPKSTGRDDFHLPWLDDHLAAHAAAGHPPVAARDVAATLVELTARSVVDALIIHAPATEDLLACGGGTRNGALMRRLATLAAPRPVRSTAVEGIDPQHVEAAAFAWLAWAHLHGRPGNRPEVTGAAGPRVLGARYPAP